MCELLVGLGDVEVLGVDDEAGEPLGVHIRRTAPRPACGACGKPLWSDGEREVECTDRTGDLMTLESVLRRAKFRGR